MAVAGSRQTRMRPAGVLGRFVLRRPLEFPGQQGSAAHRLVGAGLVLVLLSAGLLVIVRRGINGRTG